MRADRPNQLAFERLTRVWDETGTYSQTSEIRAIREQALKARHSPGRPASLIKNRIARVMLPMAASVVLLVLGTLVALQFQPGTETHRTAVGEQEIVTLVDGSVIKLNTDTVLVVAFTDVARDIRLETGQAYFSVAKDVLRPFTVTAGRGSVVALGTAFDVRKIDSRVIVTLFEGSVEVSQNLPVQEQSEEVTITTRKTVVITHSEPETGRQIDYGVAGISEPRIADLEQVTAWQEGKIVFVDMRLEEALAEVNRYSTRKIRIRDQALSDIRISGVFRTGASKTVVKALKSYFPIIAEEDEDGDTVLFVADRS